MIMGEEIEDSLGATREGSTTDWTGTTIAPALGDTKGTPFQGGAVTEVRAGDATGMERERKRGAPRSLKPLAKKRAVAILPGEVSSVETSDRTCFGQRKRAKGLPIIEGVVDTVFEKREWNTKRLQEELRRRGLPIYGTNAEKRNRLIAHMQGLLDNGGDMSPEGKDK